MSDELRDLARDLEAKAWKAIPQVAAAVAKGAHNIKERMREDAESNATTRHFAQSITYDLRRGGLEAEIGPDPARTQGPLDNILYFGDSKRGPVLDFDAAPREEEPKFIKNLDRIVGDI